MRLRLRLKVSASLVLFGLGCGGETVTVELAFPSEDAFVRSETGEIHVVPLASDESGRCPALLAQALLDPPGVEAAISTPRVDVCALRAGAVEIPDVPAGLVAFVAVARTNGRSMLAGCTVRDVHRESGPLRIVLAPTNDYRSTFPLGTPPEECSASERCEGVCP